MLHILPGGVLVINGTGQVHVEIAVQMGVWNDVGLHVDHGEAGHDGAGDDADEHEGTQHLAHHGGGGKSRASLPPVFAVLRVIGRCQKKHLRILVENSFQDECRKQHLK